MKPNTPSFVLPVQVVAARSYFNTPIPMPRTTRRLFCSAETSVDTPTGLRDLTPRGGSEDVSPSSGFSLNEECRNYLLCTYCCLMLTPPVYSCPYHPSANICDPCFRRASSCPQCHLPLPRNGQFELMLEMFSVRCEDCSAQVKLTQYSEHQRTCVAGRQLYCAVEMLDKRCGFNTQQADDLGEHLRSFHNIQELLSTDELCPLPFIQIQRSLGDLQKPIKSAHTLPFNCSIHYAYVVTFVGRGSLLVEFFYRLTTRSFFVIVRSAHPVSFQVHWLVSKHSLYGLNNDLPADKIEVMEGRACKFSADVPLHLHKADNLRSIAMAEMEVMEVMEKYSFLHGDGRFLQFAIKLV